MNLKRVFPRFIGCCVLMFLCIPKNVVCQVKDLVVVGENYEQKVSILASVPIGTQVIEINEADALWIEIRDAMLQEPQIGNLHLFLETPSEALSIGDVFLGTDSLEDDPNLNASQGSPSIKFLFAVVQLPITKMDLSKSAIHQKGCNILSVADCYANYRECHTFDFNSIGTSTSTT